MGNVEVPSRGPRPKSWPDAVDAYVRARRTPSVSEYLDLFKLNNAQIQYSLLAEKYSTIDQCLSYIFIIYN
jgi:hypothetical protein